MASEEGPGALLAMVAKEIVQYQDAGDELFTVLLRLADRRTLAMPKYAREAMDRWAKLRGLEVPQEVLEVRIEPASPDEPVHFPTPKEEEEWMKEGEVDNGSEVD